MFRSFIGAAVMGALTTFTATAQEEYPSKPIEIVVPYAAGGGTDVMVRLLQPYLENQLGENIVVLNVPGSGSVGGSRRVVEAEPDGYTVLVNHVTMLTAMALKKADFPYDDFELAADAIENPIVIAVPADSPLQNVKDLLERGKDASDPVIAGVNLGAVNHFAMLMLQSASEGTQFRFVQTGGGAETSAALLGKHIGVGVLAASEAKPLVESGDIRVIAAFGANRVPFFADVPTAHEQGYDVALGIEHFWLMPKGTPADRVEKFAAALDATIKQPEVAETLAKQGLQPSFLGGSDAWARYESLYKTFESVAADIK